MAQEKRLQENSDPGKLWTAVIHNHENANVHDIGKGEAQHRKYERLKLGGGQMYDHSSD
jgi:hypothetical protein